ncbi:hypothetical protein FB45DRAFT_1112688 [Roridomyces roridus]|uniref:F-box domain-containing protein n=1 Tax=Roridomyces roridus TaxID=1738132 RepID=A0AAD7FAW5_9AGAR|nr:hypothetical protein FB45DRAFT_1112688 [Roridomyces roridus]
MARLPLAEISSDILLQSIPTSPTWDSLWVLLRVCRAWNNLALATPFLWSTITDDGISWTRFADVLQIWLARAGGLPLSLIFPNITWNVFLRRTFQALEAQIPRIERMELSPLHDEDFTGMKYPFMGLTSLTVGQSNVSPDLCVQLLRRAPNLVHLDLYDVGFYAASIPTHLTHFTLQRLHFGRQLLTLPALQSLVLCRYHITEANLLDFLTRSAPPLRHLNLRLKTEDVRSEGIRACLRLVPCLTQLEIMLPDSPHSSFDLWTHSPDLLPLLQNLTIEEFYDHGSEAYARVVNFLAKRRDSLRSLRLIVPVPAQVLDDAVAAALRVPRDDGMDKASVR